jgi:transposase InsO family protein
MVVWRRRPTKGVIHYADQGSHYGSLAFALRARETGLVGAMGIPDDCFDNATVESLFAMLESELLAQHRT